MFPTNKTLFRDSVRSLMVSKKQAADDLNSALDDAMADFGNRAIQLKILAKSLIFRNGRKFGNR
jgi:hypothetical protein